MKKISVETIIFNIFILITSLIIIIDPQGKKEISINEYKILIEYEKAIDSNLKENKEYSLPINTDIKVNSLLKEIPTNKDVLIDIKNKIVLLKEKDVISKEAYNNFFKYIIDKYEKELLLNKEKREKIELKNIKTKFIKG